MFNLRLEKLPAAFFFVFSRGRLAPLLKAPSLLKGQYLRKQLAMENDLNFNSCQANLRV